MPLDHYVTLGRSGLRVSPFCLGAMTFGEDWGFGSPVPESEAIMARYFERGGNFIDTANGYTGGHSERIIGNFIAHDRARRNEIVIATKFFSNLSPRNPNGGGASRKAVVASCDESLRRPAVRLRQALDWLPARLLALSLALAGNFVTANRVLWARLFDLQASAAQLVVDAGRAAADSAAGKGGVETLDELWSLLLRAGLIWYSALALWILLL